jgi:serine/threonine protein kinase
MGVVYEAEQQSLGRHVALKVLPSSALLNRTYLERFRREAKAAARLHHTNIVPVFGVGEHGGVPYYAMQFIRGEGLDKVLADVRRLRQRPGEAAAEALTEGSVAHSLLTGRFSPAPAADGPGEPTGRPEPSSATSGLSASDPEADYHRGVARIGVQVAEALAYAHRQGVLHRDIKPSNLLLDQQGTVWVADFGLAKAEGADELTQTGDIVGTIRFMAPERFEGRSLPQSDVYGLGVTLYELLTLRPAFDDTNKAKLIDKVLHDSPTPTRKIDVRVDRDGPAYTAEPEVPSPLPAPLQLTVVGGDLLSDPAKLREYERGLTLLRRADFELLALRRTDADHKPRTDRIERPVFGQGG